METVCHFVRLYLGLLFLKLCGGFPIDLDSAGAENVTVWTTLTPFIAVAFLVTSVVLLVGCVCCRQNKGFQEFTDSTSSHSLSGAGGYVNSAASTTEFTIFPPVHTASAATSSSNQLSVPGDRSSVVRFEPLPDIRHSQPHSRRPAAFNNAVTHGLSSRDWFQEPHVNFPRQQLKYLRELGHGWFGRVVEGEAQGIVPEQKTSKVVVKILHEDATTTDQMYFLHEAKPYRELDHPNILKLLGRCLETDPFLVLLEACPSGDLKTFLSQNTATAEALNQQGITLQMCCNISSGLLHMHRNGFVHTDLAARNCLVTPDLSVKIGDYGTSIETFKEDYYCAGEVALPIRWCAPETLHCTETTIETKEVTASANVWSLGVVLWEVCEFGKLPYSDLSDDEVIVKVLGEGTLHLKPPSLSCPQGQNLYLLMKLCWSCMPERPPLLQVHSMLNHLYVSQEQNGKDGDSSSLKTDEDFEHRWEMFKPNSIPKTDNHIISPEKIPIVQSPTQSPGETSTRILPDDDTVAQLEEGHTLQSKALVLPPAEFESDITSRDSGNLVMDGISMTPLTTSPQPSLASSFGGEFFIPTLQQSHKSPSLQNLRGSIDDLSECTVEVTDATDWQKEDELDRVSDSMERKENAGEVLNEEGREKEVKEIVSLEPDFDSWLKGVETTNEEDAKFVRKISEAIRDLDNALALEKTSSSSSEASSKCDSHQSPARGATAEQNVVLDFRLGRADSGVSSDDKEMMFQPDSLQDDSLLDNVKSTYLEYRATDSGTDTEDEIWRRRIEQGEFSEKVKEKSKSVADLMVLTHIECSDGSDSEPPSLTWCFERSSDGRGSFSTRVRPGSLGKNVPTTFSSESNVHGAVLDEEFKATLKKQRQYIRTSKSGSDPNSSLQRFDEAKTSDVQSSNHNSSRNFLVIDASEETNKQDCVTEIIAINGETSVNEVALLCPSIAGPVLHSDVIANTAVVYDKVESKIDVNVENCVSSYSQVPEEDYMFNSMLASSCQDKKRDVVISEANDMLGADTGCAAQLGAIHHEETSKSINDNVPQKHVIESTLNNIFMLKTEALPHQNVTYQNLFSCEPHNVSSISLFATCDDFEDSFDTSTGVRTEDEYFKGEYKESNSSPLFTSAPHHPHRKVRVTDSLHPDICDFSDAIDTFPVVSDVVSTFSPSKTLNSETSFHRVDSSYIDCDHVSTSDTLSDSFHFSPVNVSDVQENVSFNKQSLQVLNSPCEPQMIFNSLNTADIPLASSKNTVPAFSLKDNKQGSMVQTTVSDFIPSVVLGPCEDYTLDYFKGLKTTSGENTSLNCEDISLHLGNNTFTDEKVEKPVSGDKQKPLLVDYCIDSWDKHLSAAFLEHEVKANFFDDISFKSGTDNLTDEDKPVNHRLTSTSNNSLEPALLNHETKEINSTFENGMRNTPALLEDSESNENLDHLHVSSKHEKLVRKTNVTKTEDSVHDADIILSFLEDVGKSTTEEEIFNSCHPRCSVNFEHDLDNIVVNVTNFVEDSQVNESHDQTSTHLKHENADTNASVSKVEGSIDSDSDITCSIVEDINVCVATHISSSTEPNGQECKMEGTAVGNKSVLTPDNFPLIEEKLKTSGLSIPSLNFISATPVPSGRNTPEMLTECTMEVSNDGTETMVNCVQPIEEVFASLIETEEEDLVFSSKERMVEENEQEIKIPLASQGACEISVNLTPDEKVSLENLSSEITSVSKLGFDTYSSASETDHSVLIVTRPLENKTSTEECGVEFSCSNVLLCAPKNSENKVETPELCEIECEEQSKPSGVIPLGSSDLRNTAQCELEVTLNTGLKSMEAVLNTVSSNPLGCHTLILKCETGSCTLPDLQNTIVTKAEVCEEVNKPTVDTKNASHVGQQTKVPFQNATSKELSSIEEHCLSLHKQDILIASNSLTLESEKSSAGSSLNDLTHEENSIIPTDLIHKQIPIIDTDLLKWGPEESKCCEQASEEDLEHIPDIVRDVHKLHFEENSMLKVSYFEQVTAETPNFAGHISVPDSEEHNTNFNSDLTDSFRTTETTHTKSPEFAEDILNVEENNENCSSEMSAYEQVYVRPIEIKHPDFVTDVLELYAKEIKESCDSGGISCEKVYMVPVEIKNVQSPDLTINVEKRNESSKFSSYKQMSFDPQKQFKILNPGQDIAETKEMCNSHLKNCEQASVEVLDLVHMPLSHIFSDKEEKVVGADDSWKQNQFDSNSRVLMEDFLLGERLASGLTTSGLDIKAEENFDATGEVEDDGEDFGLDAVKHLTPDDERSSDSGFRDKGSLSESCEEVCDEKYNLEDIEAELEDTFNRGNFNYVDEHDNEEEQNERALEDQQGKLSAKSSDDSPFIYIEEPGNGNQNHRTMEDIERKLPVRSCVDKVYNIEDLDCCDIVHNENSTDKTFEAVGGKLTKVIDMLESVEKDQAGGQFAGEVTESVIKDQLKNESLDSGDSDMKRSPELIRIQCDIDNHDDTSTGFNQPELLSVAGDYKEPILLVKLQEDIETNIIKNYTSVNKINQLLESGRESQNSEMLNLDSDTRQWQIIMDSNVIEHVSGENKQNRYPVTVPASDSRPISLTNVIPDINLTTEIHVPDKHFSNHEVKHDAILSSISPDDKVVSQMDGYCLRSTQKSGLNAYQTFSFGETCANEDACEVGDKPESASRELQHSELVQRHTTGWYLHPPLENGNYEDSKGDLVNLEECPSVTDSGPCSSKYEESNNGDNSYVSFSLDEEFVTAIRNELRDKLPCTRQQSQEEEDSEEDEILDPDDDLPQEERTDIMIHYNTYSAPLSPILEEHESGSSVTTTVSDHYSSLALSNQRDAPVSGSDSEPLSPVFVLDPRDGDSRAQYEINAKKFEQEIREALENCSLNSEGSEDISSPSNKVHNESSVLLEDLEQQPSVDTQGLSLNVTVNENIVVVHGTHQHPNGDDLLVVNTETNEATLLESLTPKSHLAFVNNRRTLQEGKSIDGLSGTPNFFGENEVIVGVNSDTFVIDRSRLIGTFEVDSKLGAGKEMSSDDEVYTPDSISEHVTGTPSESTLQSPDTENLSDFFLTPSEKSPAVSECPLGPQNSSVFNSYFLHSLSKNHDNQIFEKVQEISLGVANNEAAEIISELENSGIFNNNNNDANKETCAAVLPLCEKVSIQELPSSRTSSVNDNNEVLSVEDSSESSELTKKDSDDDKNNPARLSAVDRLDYLTSPNLDVFSMKIKESTENSEEEENSMNGNSCNRRLFLNDTLDLLKRRKDSRQNDSDLYQEDEERDWSLPNLEASILSTKAPMPSPEEESWKQIPSMLAFSDLNEVMSRCGNKQQAFDTISFNGPSQCVSYSGQTEVDDGDLMSTSFSIKGDPGDPECYTPDWESDSDETNEEDNSSSSGEFIWKPYEGLSDFPMEVIAEEEEDEEEDDDDDDADGSSSSGSGTEFVPSAWNSEATPNRSALRSPDKKSDQKKNVSFKKQKYHSVYEYPRETSDSDSEGFDSPTRRHWNSLMLQSTQQPQVDYSSFADWEMLDGDVLPEGSVPDMDIDQDIPENTTQQQLDIYKLSSVDYDFTNGMVSEDGEFYISSSARPFQFPGGSNDVLTSSGSQFFPGQLYHVGSEYKPSEITVDFVTPDVDIVNITVADKLSALETGVDSYNDEVDTSPSSMSRFSVSFNDQLTNHKSESIKGIVWEDEIDSSESGVNGTSSNRSSASSDVGEKASLESTKLQELPFTDLLELANASDPTSSIVLSVSVTNEMLSGAKSVSGCVITDKDCETVLQSPSSPLSPSGLGELRHTRDRLKLDLPLSSTAFVLDPPAVGKRRSVETVKGEASLLDSGEETEDSGIESSNGAVTREVKSPTRDISMT